MLVAFQKLKSLTALFSKIPDHLSCLMPKGLHGFTDYLDYFLNSAIEFSTHCHRTAYQDYQKELQISLLRPNQDVYLLCDYRAKLAPERSLQSMIPHP
jgi:hypothetical protein